MIRSVFLKGLSFSGMDNRLKVFVIDNAVRAQDNNHFYLIGIMRIDRSTWI